MTRGEERDVARLRLLYLDDQFGRFAPLARSRLRIFTTTTFARLSFWLGLLLVVIFGVELGWFPSSGYGDTTAEHIRSLTLPVITVGLYLAVPLLRSLRTNLIDNLDAEYTAEDERDPDLERQVAPPA